MKLKLDFLKILYEDDNGYPIAAKKLNGKSYELVNDDMVIPQINSFVEYQGVTYQVISINYDFDDEVGRVKVYMRAFE